MFLPEPPIDRHKYASFTCKFCKFSHCTGKRRKKEKRKKVTGTTYRLKSAPCVNCWWYSVPWGPEVGGSSGQLNKIAPVLISKLINDSTFAVTPDVPYVSHARLSVIQIYAANFHSQHWDLPPPPTPPPLEWTGPKAWVLTARYRIVPFLFG